MNSELKKKLQLLCSVIPWIVQRACGEGEKERTQCESVPLEIFLEKFSSLELVNKYFIKMNFHIYLINVLDLNRFGIFPILLTAKSYPRTFPLKQQRQCVYIQNATTVATQCSMINFCISLQMYKVRWSVQQGCYKLDYMDYLFLFSKLLYWTISEFICTGRKKKKWIRL